MRKLEHGDPEAFVNENVVFRYSIWEMSQLVLNLFNFKVTQFGPFNFKGPDFFASEKDTKQQGWIRIQNKGGFVMVNGCCVDYTNAQQRACKGEIMVPLLISFIRLQF